MFIRQTWRLQSIHPYCNWKKVKCALPLYSNISAVESELSVLLSPGSRARKYFLWNEIPELRSRRSSGAPHPWRCLFRRTEALGSKCTSCDAAKTCRFFAVIPPRLSFLPAGPEFKKWGVERLMTRLLYMTIGHKMLLLNDVILRSSLIKRLYKWAEIILYLVIIRIRCYGE